MLAALAWVAVAATRVTRTALREQDSSRWHAGLFYADPDDPAVFVANPGGMGTTVNLGRPLGWLVLAALLLPAAAVVVVGVLVQ